MHDLYSAAKRRPGNMTNALNDCEPV
jgi:hypothetical protein